MRVVEIQQKKEGKGWREKKLYPPPSSALFHSARDAAARNFFAPLYRGERKSPENMGSRGGWFLSLSLSPGANSFSGYFFLLLSTESI